ncbi:MAG: TonB-dependent receptor plug domain-containing protein [Lentimicrobiaceae bacterium]|nr:TonB-dependent receptor plug domain-containing protein [Lentimicrobiaceae bacterium]
MGFFFAPATVCSAMPVSDSISRHYYLDEVVIKAPSKNVISPQKLDGAVLERLNSLSVADAIRFFSGVQIKDYGGVGGIKTVNIRSMGTNQTGVYYNGIQLGNAQNGQIDLGKFSLENIDEIALYNGQKSDILQSAREFGSSGNIYLNSRRPKFEEGKNFHLRAAMKTGSFALINPSALLEYRLSDKISLSMNAEVLSSNGKYKFRYRRITPSGQIAYDTTAVRQNGDINAVRAEGGLQHYYSGSGIWKLQVYHYNSERGIPGAIVNNVWRRGERLWDRNSFVQTSWQDEFFACWQLRFNAKYAYDYTHYINNDDKLIHVDNIYVQRELYASLVNKVEVFKWWEASIAYDFQWNGMEKYLNVSRNSHWLAIATAMNLFEHLKIQASVLGTFINEEARSREEVPKKYKVTPGLFISYRPFKKIGLSFNAFYKQSYRYPTFNDLYYTDMGNAYLKPELAVQHNVGIMYEIERKEGIFHLFELKADYYYNRIRDKIIAYPKGQQFRWTMLNLGKVKINGLDATARLVLQFPHHWSLTGRLQYTYQTALDLTDPSDTYYGNQIPYIPWHSGSATGMLTWKNYALNYSFIYVGKRYNQQENIVYNYTQPWYTHDLSLSGSWRIKKTRLKTTLEINNLLSQDYDVILNYPMPRRNYRISLIVEY